MSITPPTKTSIQATPAPERRDTVVMGRQGYFSVVFRLIGVELYKLRRRKMSKTLGFIALLSVIAAFTLVTASTASVRSNIESHPSQTTSVSGSTYQGQTDQLREVSQPLRLPTSLTTTGQVINYVELILIIILAGTIVGGEYGVGTIRLILTRSPTRTQFLLSKLGALFVALALSTTTLMVVGILLGALANFVVGVPTDFSFLTGSWLLHAFLFLLAIILGLFVYAAIVTCLSVIGKATAAGVAGGLIWWFLEGLLNQILPLLAEFKLGELSTILRTIPNYFIGNNTSALIQNQMAYLQPSQEPMTLQSSNLHALLVIAAYLLVFTGLAWWINERRDITN